jgi:hypothetical protein
VLQAAVATILCVLQTTVVTLLCVLQAAVAIVLCATNHSTHNNVANAACSTHKSCQWFVAHIIMLPLLLVAHMKELLLFVAHITIATAACNTHKRVTTVVCSTHNMVATAACSTQELLLWLVASSGNSDASYKPQ